MGLFSTFVLITVGELNTVLNKIYRLCPGKIIRYVVQSVQRSNLTNAYTCFGVKNLGQYIMGEYSEPGTFHCCLLVFKDVRSVEEVAKLV